MPHRRKPAKPSKKSSVRLRAHRIPPTVLNEPAQGSAALPVMSPSASGVLPAIPLSRGQRHVSPKAALSASPWWGLLAAALLGVLMVLAITTLNPFALPQTGHAYAPAQTDSQAPSSTPVALWKKGAVPHLYSADQQWGTMPYGASTLALSGAAPTAVAMVHVFATGSTEVTPAEVAKWANENNSASTSPQAIDTVLTDGAAQFGLEASPIENTNIAIRQAVASGKPVVAVLAQGTNGPVETTVVICAVDQESRLVVNDPTSVENTARSWSFEEILDDARELYAYSLAA